MRRVSSAIWTSVAPVSFASFPNCSVTARLSS